MIDNVSEFSNDRYRLMTIKFLQSRVRQKERVQFRVQSIRDMRDSVTTTARMEAVLRRDSSRIVVAHLTERDFASARLTIPEIGAFKDYEDWLDFRASGLFWSAKPQVFLSNADPGRPRTSLTNWREATSTLPSISALDQFAGSLTVVSCSGATGRQQVPGLLEPFADEKGIVASLVNAGRQGPRRRGSTASNSTVLQPTSRRRKIPYQQIWRGFSPGLTAQLF